MEPLHVWWKINKINQNARFWRGPGLKEAHYIMFYIYRYFCSVKTMCCFVVLIIKESLWYRTKKVWVEWQKSQGGDRSTTTRGKKEEKKWNLMRKKEVKGHLERRRREGWNWQQKMTVSRSACFKSMGPPGFITVQAYTNISTNAQW